MQQIGGRDQILIKPVEFIGIRASLVDISLICLFRRFEFGNGDFESFNGFEIKKISVILDALVVKIHNSVVYSVVKIYIKFLGEQFVSRRNDFIVCGAEERVGNHVIVRDFEIHVDNADELVVVGSVVVTEFIVVRNGIDYLFCRVSEFVAHKQRVSEFKDFIVSDHKGVH